MSVSDHRPKFVALAWISFSFGIAATVLIPIPILNNIGGLLGVIGAILGLIAVCFGSRKLIASMGLVLSLIGLAGTIAIQKHWGEQFDKIQQEIDRDFEDPPTTDPLTYEQCMIDLNDESKCWSFPNAGSETREPLTDDYLIDYLSTVREPGISGLLPGTGAGNR